MHPLAQQVGQRHVNEPLPRDAAQPGEPLAHHRHGEMAFAAAVMPRMAAVALAVVDNLEQRGGQRLGQALFDLGRHRPLRSFSHAPHIAGLMPTPKDRPNARLHGRVENAAATCAHPGCTAPGEFRAPPAGDGRGDRPPAWRWFCLDHVRAFNAGYNFFSGMSTEEIEAAQRPMAGWERETRAFAHSGADRPPRWADFADPLDAIGARFRHRARADRADGKPLSGENRRDLDTLGLAADADRKALRTRYTELVRRYHPDHNGGDRANEAKLRGVIDAYQRLKKAPAFA